MENKILIYSTIQYGDVRAVPIDHVRKKNNDSITFVFDCLTKMTPKNRDQLNEDAIDQIKIPHDTIKYDYKPRGKYFLNYTLKKFCYQLRKDRKGIQNIKMIYLNPDGKEEEILETSDGKLRDYPEKIEFEEGEAIESIIVYLKKEALCGLDITTNRRKGIVIGNNQVDRNEDTRRVMEENHYENKVMIGLGCTANAELGVTSIFFYFVDKKTYSICQTYGLRQLRAKIKSNEEYKKEIEDLRPKLNNEQKLLSDVAALPDAVFFSVLKYVMPY